MKYGIYLAGRAGTTSAKPDRPAKIASAVEDLTGGTRHVIREYIHFLGTDPDREIVRSLGAADELVGLTMPDEWYLKDGRELDLVVSYLPPTEDVPGWLAFLDAVLERYGHIVRYLQVTLEPNFPIPLIDGSSPGSWKPLLRAYPMPSVVHPHTSWSASQSLSRPNGSVAMTSSGRRLRICQGNDSPTMSTTSVWASTRMPSHLFHRKPFRSSPRMRCDIFDDTAS